MAEYAWIGWLISAVAFITGICVTRYYKKKDRLTKAIETYQDLVVKIEDMALDYWVLNDLDTYEWQITLQLRRLSRSIKEITRIDDTLSEPSREYIAFKQAVNLIPVARPIQHNSVYALKIMEISVKLQDFYEKP